MNQPGQENLGVSASLVSIAESSETKVICIKVVFINIPKSQDLTSDMLIISAASCESLALSQS